MASELTSIPNLLSLSRLALAVAFVVLPSPTARLALVVVAALTDYLDGWLARRAKLATRWGALIDPISDRIFVFTAVCVYLINGTITTGQYFIIIARDLATAIGFVVARTISWLRPVPFRARMAGKIVTTLQLATLIALIIRPDLVATLVMAVGLTSAVAIVDYTLALWRERVRTPA
jgi:CDP-diacylglycerol--glycerol-3-phosphate 3-phosphatidyltransferase/cardiolipin synthase